MWLPIQVIGNKTYFVVGHYQGVTTYWMLLIIIGFLDVSIFKPQRILVQLHLQTKLAIILRMNLIRRVLNPRC